MSKNDNSEYSITIGGLVLFGKVELDANKKTNAQKTFQGLFIGGITGLLFYALAFQTYTDFFITGLEFEKLKEIYTLHRGLGYFFLLWCIAYFVISHMLLIDSEEATVQDVIFDVVQTLLAFFVLLQFGFVASAPDFKYAFYSMNLYFVIVGFSSTLIFRRGVRNTKEIQTSRRCLALLGGVGMVLTLVFEPFNKETGYIATLGLWLLVIIHIILMIAYGRERLKKTDINHRIIDSQEARRAAINAANKAAEAAKLAAEAAQSAVEVTKKLT